MQLPIELPPPPGDVIRPFWVGNGFVVGQNFRKVLAYETGNSGWTDDLTTFHENTAGDDHYIDRASRAHALKSLTRLLPSPTAVIMDIGCSSGFMLRMLKNRFPKAAVLGADYVCGPLEQLAHTLAETPLLQFDLVKCPLPNSSLDAVVLLNVLEHIEDDGAAMRQVARILKPGGLAVVEVPAGPALYDIYDKQLMHHRRYRMSDLVSKLTQSGLRVVERSHLGCFVYPAFWVVKKWGKRFMKEDDHVQQQVVAERIKSGRSNAMLHAVLRLEATLRNGIYYPFGIRCLVTCKK